MKDRDKTYLKEVGKRIASKHIEDHKEFLKYYKETTGREWNEDRESK